MALTKAQIVGSISQQLGFKRKKSAETIETLLEILKKTFESGDDVLLPPRVRNLRSSFVTQIEEMERRGASTEELRAFIGPGKALEGMIQGDMEDRDPICGLVAAMVKDIPPAGEIIKRTVDGAAAVIEKCRRSRQN